MRLARALLCLLAASGEASAGPVVLLESSAGDAPSDAVTLERFIAALPGHELLHGAALRDAIEARHSRDAGAPAAAAALRPAVEEGGRLFIEGEFPAAVAQLEGAREALHRQVAARASDPSLRDALHRALLFLAHAYLRVKQPERARERAAEAIRSFPDRDLSLIQVHYGPELAALFRSVRAELDRRGRATLIIDTQPPGCLVFVDERFVGVSPARVGDLYPGPYRVHVQRQKLPGRVHPLTVAQGESRLRIPFDLDSALRTAPRVGLHFADLTTLERRETSLAASLGDSLGASSVLLVGPRLHRGRRALLGSSISPRSGRVVRSALVLLDPAPPSSTLRSLGRFLLLGERGEGLILEATGDAPAVAPGHRPAFFSARVFKWVTLGAALAGAAAGATLLALDGRGSCDDPAGRRCPERYDTRLAGILTTSAAGVAAAGSGFLFYWDARAKGTPPRGAGLLPWLARGVGMSALIAY